MFRTRAAYSDNREPPAIHPRYRAAYHKIYPEDGEDALPGTFLLRTLLCFMIFAAFVLMDYNGVKVAGVNSSQVTEAVEAQITAEDLEEVWQEL